MDANTLNAMFQALGIDELPSEETWLAMLDTHFKAKFAVEPSNKVETPHLDAAKILAESPEHQALVKRSGELESKANALEAQNKEASAQIAALQSAQRERDVKFGMDAVTRRVELAVERRKMSPAQKDALLGQFPKNVLQFDTSTKYDGDWDKQVARLQAKLEVYESMEPGSAVPTEKTIIHRTQFSATADPADDIKKVVDDNLELAKSRGIAVKAAK